MSARAKAIAPLAIVIGVLSFLWTEFSLNFTFQWFTTEIPDAPINQPENFHLILPIAFISWGLFFAAGGDNAAAVKIAVASIFGTVAALITMPLAFTTADFPDFWGIALWVGIFAFILVIILVAGDWYYVAGTFPAFASVFVWWIATGLDGWVPDGGAEGGGGAAGGLISTPWPWVWFSVLVTLLAGVVLGLLSAKITAAVTPKPAAADS